MKTIFMARKDLWTREQTIIAFELYSRIPFGQAHSRNIEVKKVAKLVGRTPGAVARKLGNFGSLDPELKARGVVGLVNRSNLDEVIWNEFHGNWNEKSFEAAKLIAKYEHQTIEEYLRIDVKELPKGVDKMRMVKTRVNQKFFHDAVFAAHENTCCITGMKVPALQVASHIKPWSVDADCRTNPQNGLCLNALHDKAFDKGLITILPDFSIKISKHLEDYDHDIINRYFIKYKNKKIIKPHKSVPEKEFLEYHNEIVFRR